MTYDWFMTKIWTADELMAMSPAERESLFLAQSSDNLADVPPSLLESARAKIRNHIGQTESTSATER